jgi:NAD(P)H-dependent FMN reductase
LALSALPSPIPEAGVHASRRSDRARKNRDRRFTQEVFMTQLKIAVIAGSTRPGRRSRIVSEWIVAQACSRPGISYQLIDLADYNLPLLDEPAVPAIAQYRNEHTIAWSRAVSQYDGYVFVTPEYNHSISAALKNALDYLFVEWNDKAAAFASYGSTGGIRAVQQLRTIASSLEMAHVRPQLSFSLFDDFDEAGAFIPRSLHAGSAATLFEQLESWAGALQQVRAPQISVSVTG